MLIILVVFLSCIFYYDCNVVNDRNVNNRRNRTNRANRGGIRGIRANRGIRNNTLSIHNNDLEHNILRSNIDPIISISTNKVSPMIV